MPPPASTKRRQLFAVALLATSCGMLPWGPRMVTMTTAYVVNPSSLTRSTRRASSTRLFSTATSAPATSTLADGIVKTVTKVGSGPVVNPGDIVTVRYTCTYNEIPFSRSSFQKVVAGDGSMIPGWDKALKSMRVGEEAIVQLLSPQWGYGSVEVPGILPRDAAPLILELEVLDVQNPTDNIDFDSLATADATPRTASDIAAAFERKQAQKAALGPAKEGLDAWIEKAQNFYFFGLFEGETGERPPWFLRPSITFPLAFLVVGAAFYITFAGGAIYERGAQVKDELDEFIVSYNHNGASPLPASIVVAMSFLSGSF